MARRQFTVYALIDPRDYMIRYVGMIASGRRYLTRRVSSHVCESRAGRLTPKSEWLREVLRDGFRPHVAVLQELDDQAIALAAETNWIRTLLTIGLPLTNVKGALVSDSYRVSHLDVYRARHRAKTGSEG